MKKICLLIFIITNAIAYSQDYTYTHYDAKDGLAGSTVYCADQDKDGFIWFGTETGLSRFDGTNFLNFTIDQGLPDNEVIKIFCDSHNRVWLSLFRPEICYIYNGKVHNQSNDSLLKKIHLKGIAWQVCEDKDGDILIREYAALHIITPSGIIRNISRLSNHPGFFSASAINQNGNFLVCDSTSIYEVLANGDSKFLKRPSTPLKFAELLKLSSKIVFTPADSAIYEASTLQGNVIKFYHNPPTIINSQILKDSLICFNKINGCFIENFYTQKRLGDLLPAEQVSSAFIDDEGTYWFTTLGHGIFKLNSSVIKTIQLKRESGNTLSVFSITKFNNSIVIGTDGCYLFFMDPSKPDKINRYKFHYPFEVKSRVLDIETFDNNLYVGTDDIVFETKFHQIIKVKNFLGVKDMFLLNQDTLLIGTTKNLLLFDTRKFRISKSFFDERVTCLNSIGSQIYIGTIDGLVIKDLVTGVETRPNIPLLKNRITAIEKDSNNVFWISTYGAGVVAYKNGKILIEFSMKNGLNSNICRCLSVSNKTLWVGTDMGLNQVSLEGSPRVVAGFSNTDGLPSNIINTVYEDSETVFVGTSGGITYFNSKNSNPKSKCLLYVKAISSGSDTLSGINIRLHPAHNEIKFDYVAVSFNSGGHIKYYYKIDQLKNTWDQTNNTSITFPSLPPGNYTFRIKAINKYGINSRTIVIPFMVEKKLWQQVWFQVGAVILIALLLWYFIGLRIKSIKRQASEKKIITEQIAELKQKALKSQINPHFVFNCLNSIQQYIIDNDIQGSNRFITSFARIIRKTLDFSERNEISLKEELSYLDDYLKLEQERFENSFQYFLNIDESVNTDFFKLPPLLLQPLIENAIRHGVRARADEKGVINITTELDDSYVSIIIQDNGPGILYSKQSRMININHNSMGINLVKERIKVLNDLQNQKILFSVSEVNNTSSFKGTIIKIQFPV